MRAAPSEKLPPTVRMAFTLRTSNGSSPAVGVFARALADQLIGVVKPNTSRARGMGREVIATVRLERADEAAAQRVAELVQSLWPERHRSVDVLPLDTQGRPGLRLTWPTRHDGPS